MAGRLIMVHICSDRSWHPIRPDLVSLLDFLRCEDPKAASLKAAVEGVERIPKIVSGLDPERWFEDSWFQPQISYDNRQFRVCKSARLVTQWSRQKMVPSLNSLAYLPSVSLREKPRPQYSHL